MVLLPSKPRRNPPTAPSFPAAWMWAHSRGKSWDSSSWSIRGSALFLRGKPGKSKSRGSSGVHCCLLLPAASPQLGLHSSIGMMSTKSKRESHPPLLEVLGFGDSRWECCSSSELQACHLLSSWAQAPAHKGDKEKGTEWKKSRIRGDWQVDDNLKHVGLCFCPVSNETPGLSSRQHA